MDAAKKTGLYSLKNCYQKIAHKAPETEGEFIGNKITDQVLKPKHMPYENARNVEDISSYSTWKKENKYWTN